MQQEAFQYVLAASAADRTWWWRQKPLLQKPLVVIAGTQAWPGWLRSIASASSTARIYVFEGEDQQHDRWQMLSSSYGVRKHQRMPLQRCFDMPHGGLVLQSHLMSACVFCTSHLQSSSATAVW